MATAHVQLMSRLGEEGTSEAEPEASAPRTRFDAVSDAIGFALVGVALVGFVVETLDIGTDNLRGIGEVAAGAFAGVLASFVYRRV